MYESHGCISINESFNSLFSSQQKSNLKQFTPDILKIDIHYSIQQCMHVIIFQGDLEIKFYLFFFHSFKKKKITVQCRVLQQVSSLREQRQVNLSLCTYIMYNSSAFEFKDIMRHICLAKLL